MMIEEEVKKTTEILDSHGIILYPTETVWGIGCNAKDDIAVEKIFKLKKRQDSKAMLVLVDSVDMAFDYVKKMPELASELWNISDKPLTLVLPGGVGVSSLIIPEEGTIAIRVTSNIFCQKLIRSIKSPLVSTSANLSGQTAAKHLRDASDYIKNGVDYIVDESMDQGSTGAPSSIISLGLSNEVKILRN